MNLFAIAGLSCSIATIIIAVLTYFFGKAKIHRILLFFNLMVALWGGGLYIVGIANTEQTALLGWKVAHLGGLFIGVLFYHMVKVFCGIHGNKLLYFAYIQAIFFNVLNLGTKSLINKTRFVFGLYYNDVTPFLIVGIIIYVFFVILSYYELLKFHRRTSGYKRIQTKYIMYGFMFGFLGGTSTFLPEFRIDLFYPAGNFGITLYCLIVSYAVLRHRLMDINLVIKRTMVYSLAAGILTSFFVVFVLLMTTFVTNIIGINSFAITVIAALIIAILFHPLRIQIQKLVDKVFYKKTYDYFSTVQKVSHELSSMFDTKKIFSFVGDILFTTLGLKKVFVLSAVTGGDFEVVYQKSNPDIGGIEQLKRDSEIPGGNNNNNKLRLERTSRVLTLLKEPNDIIVKDELPGIVEIIGQEIIDDFSNNLKPFHGEVLIPVFVDNKLTVLIILGEKLSGDFFTNEDINLLNTISNQTAIALKNASLYHDKLSSEKFASMGLMSATFAHEVRNPLTSIKTFIQLMPEKYNDLEFREIFSKVVVGDVERIDGLIRELLSYSSGKIVTFKDKLELVSLIDETANYLNIKLDLERKNISVEKIYKSVKINIEGDPRKLKQAFINIITNGCQAIGEYGILRITITSNDHKVDITISDTGSGISEEDMERIFNPFYTNKPLGLGLGLAITKKIIEEHKGLITVDSEISKGTTFTVSLPLQNQNN
jgi:signal transduction histidine kinase